MSLIADIADAVVVALNGHIFSQNFAAARAWRPRRELEALSALAVVVVPKTSVMERIDRSVFGVNIDLDVCILKKLVSDENVDADPLFALGEEITEFLRETSIVTAGGRKAQWMRVAATDPLYSVEHWDADRVFLSPQTHTYKVFG